MTEMVKLFPGVTVPRSIAPAVKHGTIEDRIVYDAAAGAESSNGSESIDSEAAAIIGDIERFLEKERARGRRRETEFRDGDGDSKNYRWRKDGFQESRYKQPSRRPMTPLKVELREAYESEVATKNSHWGVNAILDYIGIPDGGKRNEFLSQFDGDVFYGVDAVRTAFHIASFYGVIQHYKGPEDKKKEILRAMIQSVGINGTRLTDAVIERFGIESLPKIVADYSPLRINGLLSLVPTSDLGKITSAMRNPTFDNLRGPRLMRELGYVAYILGGTPLLYSNAMK